MGDGQEQPDRRRGDRVIVHGTIAEITIPDKCEGLKIVRDISLYGLYLFGELEAELYDRCYLKLSGLKDNQIELALKIVRLEQEGVGMEYLDVPYSTCELLRTLMLYKAKDPLKTAKLFTDACSEIRNQDK